MNTTETEPIQDTTTGRIEKNGVRQPKEGTLVRKIWDACDELTATKGSTVSRSEIIKHFGESMKLNTVSTQYAYWRRFNGIGGRVRAGADANAPLHPNQSAVNEKNQAELEAFAEIAPDWFQKATFVRKNHAFFKNFFLRENLEKLDWPKVQELAGHLHCFYTNGMARARAAGRPNHDIEHYRTSFTYLAHGPDEVSERIRRFSDDEKYSLFGFGKSAVSEIVGYLFPDQFMFYNRRDKFGADYLGIQLPSSGPGDTVALMRAFHEATRPLADAYRQIVTPQTDLPLNLELDQFFSWLYETKEEEDASIVTPPSDETGPNYWLYAPGEQGRYWDECQKLGIMSIGWDELGDFNAYADADAMLEKMKSTGLGDREPTNNAKTCWSFFHRIKIGDIVFAKQGKDTLFGIGKVTGDYRFDPARKGHGHIRSVNWTSTFEKQLPDDAKKFPLKTLTRVTNPQRLEMLLKLAQTKDVTVTVELPLPPYTLQHAMEDLFMDKATLGKIIKRLERKKCLILKGPPGVGKTFVARRLAYVLMTKEDDSRIEMVQFHPNYSYEDFVQGYRPDGKGGFARKNGIFHEFATKARNDSERDYVFIIDEINRGNLAKIFGELLMLIEADKRSPKYALQLAYHDPKNDSTRFHLPNNLHIIGTMNTADRSLDRIDYALRRRFAFETLKPAFSTEAFATWIGKRGASQALIDKIRERVGTLNEAIANEHGLGLDFQIGHSFFCPSDMLNNDSEDSDNDTDNNDAAAETPDSTWYNEVIEGEIRPLLEEYFDDREEVQRHMENLKR